MIQISMPLIYKTSYFSQMDPESDREIADHVVRMHRYRKPGEMDGERK